MRRLSSTERGARSQRAGCPLGPTLMSTLAGRRRVHMSVNAARKSACATLILCILLVPIACKPKRKRPPLEPISQTGMLASMINVADPHSTVQLTKGFYDIENGAWRWTARSFSATLRPPKDAAQNGARLVLKLAISDVVLQKLKSMRLSASVNGLELPPEEYTKAGEFTYSREVPPTALKSDAVMAEFTLDKALPPSASDQRELGVIVSAIGFEAN
jgi:hypothetical protein